MKDERAYLLHAIEAIDAILSYTVDGREAFMSDGKTQDAVIRNIEIIGQAVDQQRRQPGPIAKFGRVPPHVGQLSHADSRVP